MIRCTKCLTGIFFEQSKNSLICEKCGFELSVCENLIVFHREESTTHGGWNHASSMM